MGRLPWASGPVLWPRGDGVTLAKVTLSREGEWRPDANHPGSAPFCAAAGGAAPGKPRSVGQEAQRGAQRRDRLDAVSGKTRSGWRGWELPCPVGRHLWPGVCLPAAPLLPRKPLGPA